MKRQKQLKRQKTKLHKVFHLIAALFHQFLKIILSCNTMDVAKSVSIDQQINVQVENLKDRLAVMSDFLVGVRYDYILISNALKLYLKRIYTHL